MNSDPELWLRSYEYLPFGAGEDKIAATETHKLESAYRLMAACKRKPPQVSLEYQAAQVLSILIHGYESLSSYCRTMVQDEVLRYARVCRELGKRMEAKDPTMAVVLLRSAIMPASCAFAFENLNAWLGLTQGIGGLIDKKLAEVQAITERLRSLSRAVIKSQVGNELLLRCVIGLFELTSLSAALEAAMGIDEGKDEWNFRIEAWALTIEQRLGHEEIVRKLKDECLGLLRSNENLCIKVLGAAVAGSVVGTPTSLPPIILTSGTPTSAPSDITSIGSMLSRLLRSELEPLLGYMNQNLQLSSQVLQITSATQERMDLVIDRVIDLDQRSRLTWAQVSQIARREPDYGEMRRRLEASLAVRLSSAWGSLKTSSRKDLIDSEYVFQHCSKWGSGWRMAALGYCTTIERELRASYPIIVRRLLGSTALDQQSKGNLGDLIRRLEALKGLVSKHKPPSLVVSTLLNSIEVLWKLNSIRIKAAHPKEQEVSGNDIVWLENTLLGQPSLLVAILAVRVEDSG